MSEAEFTIPVFCKRRGVVENVNKSGNTVNMSKVKTWCQKRWDRVGVSGRYFSAEVGTFPLKELASRLAD